MTRSKKGGAVELAPVAAAGVLLAAQKMYKDMVAEDKKAAVPSKRFPRSQRRQRGGMSSAAQVVFTDFKNLSPEDQVEVATAIAAFVAAATAATAPATEPMMSDAAAVSEASAAAFETAEAASATLNAEGTANGGAKKRRSSKKRSGGAAGSPLSPAEALIPKMDMSASELAGGAKKSKSRKPRKMTGGEASQYAASISDLARQLSRLM